MTNDDDNPWDVIVVGAGMGGGAAAHSLSRNGHNVLLLEMGLSEFLDSEHDPSITDPSRLLQEGRWPSNLASTIDSKDSELVPALGCGVGGSTLLYAATLERLDPGDFEHRILPSGEEIEWPFTYADLEPYYLQAEQLLRVRGTKDLLEAEHNYQLLDPPQLSESDQSLFNALEKVGLHPYRIHVGIDYVDGCDECGGRYCARECKADAKNRFIDPALKTNKLTILPSTTVDRIEVAGNRVASVTANTPEGTKQFKSSIVVLAAGALCTPAVLLRSKSSEWPNGAGNKNDLVGRHLMFHASDFVALWPPGRFSRAGPKRSIAFRDFYCFEGTKLGEVQTTGLTAGFAEILYYFYLKFDQSPLRKIRFLRHLLRIPAYVGTLLFKEATVFSTIVEDFPYPDNRVIHDPTAPNGIRFEYTIRRELKTRVKTLRRLLKSKFRGLRILFFEPEVSLNFGHACGTCRAGFDAAKSVVDENCEVHGISNLFVADGSFMPSSGGTNPSLTIAANALRVADIIDQRLSHYKPD